MYDYDYEEMNYPVEGAEDSVDALQRCYWGPRGYTCRFPRRGLECYYTRRGPVCFPVRRRR